MKKAKNNCIVIYVIAIIVFVLRSANVMAQDSANGFASVSGDGLSTTTGGANATSVTVTSYSDLKTQCGSSSPLVIIVDGAISGSGNITVKSNKTILGKGTTAKLSGFGLDMNGVSNIIIRNLKITGAVDGIAARSTHHLWVDHCEIWDCSDGLLDITVASSYCTVSWCKFYYVNQTDHRFACLIGNGGGTAPNDWGRNKVTYHHNWFHSKVDQRQPRLMYGQGHAYNNYYTCTGNSYCIGVGSYAAALIENNYFQGVKNPHQFMYDIYCHITARGNTYDNTTGSKDTGLGGSRKESGQDFNVVAFTSAPYSYSMDNASNVPTIVSNSAGPQASSSSVPVTGVTASPASTSLSIGGTTQLTATVAPSNASNKTVTWSSSTMSVATVSSAGLVTGVAAGSAVITVTTQDGNKTATCAVTVNNSSTPSPLVKLGFNENTGSTVANDGTAPATFTKTAPPAWSANVPVNGGASSVDFGTTTGNYYVESSSAISQLAGLTSFTVTGWVNCKNLTIGSGGNRIVSWINNGGNGVDIVHLADGSLKVGINQWPDASTAVSSTGKVTANSSAPSANWKFFAVTYQSSTGNLQFYFGDNSNPASLDKSLTYSKGAVGASIGSLAIGHFNSQSSRTTRTDRMFKGLIDQIEIYSSVLSLMQIQAAQNLGTLKSEVLAAKEGVGNLPAVLYPNPVSNELTVDLGTEMPESTTIQMFDNTGRMVFSMKANSTKHNINMGDLPSGLYLVKISNASNCSVKHIVKN